MGFFWALAGRPADRREAAAAPGGCGAARRGAHWRRPHRPPPGFEQFEHCDIEFVCFGVYFKFRFSDSGSHLRNERSSVSTLSPRTLSHKLQKPAPSNLRVSRPQHTNPIKPDHDPYIIRAQKPLKTKPYYSNPGKTSLRSP